MTQLARTDYPGRNQVGWWQVSSFNAAGDAEAEEVYGQLVLQEHHVLVMDPETKGIKWSVPCVNAGPTRPVADL